MTFISNMAAIRGEESPLKIFSVHFFDMTNPQTNFKLSLKIINGEKRSHTYRPTSSRLECTSCMHNGEH